MRIWLAVLISFAPIGDAFAAAPGEFSLYVLSLTWTPAFCAGGGDQNPENAEQCSSKAGFMIHGLWPQADKGRNPESCALGGDVTAESVKPVRNGDLQMPNSQKLFNHEWNKHGTCSGYDQAGYFKKTADAAARVNVPEILKNLTGTMYGTAQNIEDLFLAANPGVPPDRPGLRADQIVVRANRYGRFYDVLVCMNKDLEFTTCKNVRERPEARGVLLPNNPPAVPVDAADDTSIR